MKLAYKISVSVLTFFIGCSLVWIYSDYTKSIIFKPNLEMLKQSSLLNGIKPIMRGCGSGYWQSYELPNGESIGESNECYLSFKEAKERMNIWFPFSTEPQIVERISPSNSKGESKSDRIVAVFPEDEFGNRHVTIRWVHGQCIYSIDAPSILYALEFERSEFNPYEFED